MASAQPYQLTARTLALSDVIPTQAADGATEVGKNTIQDVADLVTAGEVVTVKVSLTSAEILQLNSTPIELIAAQGTGTLIRLIAGTFQYNYGTTSYTAGNVRIYYTSGGSYIMQNAILGNGSYGISYGSFTTSPVFVTPENEPLMLDSNFNPTDGDGTLDIFLTYSVIEL